MAHISRTTQSFDGLHRPSPPHSLLRPSRLPGSKGGSPVRRPASPFLGGGKVKGEVGGTSGVGELGDPPTIEQMRKAAYRGKPRPVSANLLASFNDASDFKSSNSKTHIDSISLLEDEIRHLKKDLREKSDQIRDLKRIIRESELREMSSEMRSSSEYERALCLKDEEIAIISEKLSLYEARKYDEVDSEVKRLANLYVTSEAQLAQARAETEAMSVKMKEVEAKHNVSGLYDILARFQGENKALMEEIRRLQAQVLSQSSLSTLEREFQEVEQMQNKLISDNGRLKQDLESHKEAWYHLHEKLTEIAVVFRDCRKDMSQLTEVIRIVRKGEGVSAALILGHVSQQVSPQSPQESAEVVLEQDSKALKADLAVLRQFLSDIYAEQSSHLCTPQ